jgi:hypothetical protein
LRPDKTYRQGAEVVLNMFIGEMNSLGFEPEDIVTAVIEKCDPDSVRVYEEIRQQFNHLKEIPNA